MSMNVHVKVLEQMCMSSELTGEQHAALDAAIAVLKGISEQSPVAWARLVYAVPAVYATEMPNGHEAGEVVDVEFHNRAEKPEGEGWRPLLLADVPPSASILEDAGPV